MALPCRLARETSSETKGPDTQSDFSSRPRLLRDFAEFFASVDELEAARIFNELVGPIRAAANLLTRGDAKSVASLFDFVLGRSAATNG